jgi:glycosyltransferase involved in cell wall biosynthesis
LEFSSINGRGEIKNSINLKYSFFKNAQRSHSDYTISKYFGQELQKKSGLIEFMDIHSEGYYFLKNNPSKRSLTIIRSHTPFTLLKQYYHKEELSGVDTWFATEREKKCFEWTKNITTPSLDLKNQLINLFNINSEKITVIPNILDTQHFKPEKKPVSNNFVILHVGRYERAKGVETLNKSFIQIAKKYENVELINVGTPRGNSLEKCQIELSKNNLLDRVTFTGFVPYENLPSYYHKADLVVVPSEIYESFSYTVAQGMACGKPVIASRIGGIPETLDHGNAGTLFNPGDQFQLTEKIEELIQNKTMKEALGIKARDFAVDNFSVGALKPKYIEYYQSILD